MDQLTANEQFHADRILHEDFQREPDPELHKHVGWVAVGKSGYWVLGDTRIGKALYGHC